MIQEPQLEEPIIASYLPQLSENRVDALQSKAIFGTQSSLGKTRIPTGFPENEPQLTFAPPTPRLIASRRHWNPFEASPAPFVPCQRSSPLPQRTTHRERPQQANNVQQPIPMAVSLDQLMRRYPLRPPRQQHRPGAPFFQPRPILRVR